MFEPRPKQQEVLEYRGGRMAVLAVPGSGKTRTLSYLAARLVAEVPLEDRQEILVVTLVKSAVGHFARQVGEFVKEQGLLPGVGYRVRTLHSLANDIVRERPGLVALADDFTVIDEREADDILQSAAEAWARSHAEAADAYLSAEHFNDQYVRNRQWPDLVKNMAGNFIRQAKDEQLSVEQVRDLLAAYRRPLPLAEMCFEIYAQYENSLAYRGAVDFQDLIRLALRVLQLDSAYLERLQQRWPYILEDEAQDSSQLQQQILSLLTGESGNWVRVGDPNQAIYESFTTANPRFLREFAAQNGVQARELPNSGRSTASIIKLANQLIHWSMQHPNSAIRAMQPLAEPLIEATPPGDPQGNPPDAPDQVTLYDRAFTSAQEREAIMFSLKTWLPDNSDKTVAVLLPINASGATLVQELRAAKLPYVENLRSTTGTRAVVGALSIVLDYLSDPKNSTLLAGVYRVWRREDRDDEEQARVIGEIARELRQIDHLEDFLWPRLMDWLDTAPLGDDSDVLRTHLDDFRKLVRRWQLAADLPVDQMILTIGGDLFAQEFEIATAYSVALHMRRFSDLHPEARLPEFTEELQLIARGQRNFSGISGDDDAFDPEQHKGKVTVTTMHKAKGLEWDRVYIMSASNYDYPSADSFDTFIGERWFIRDNLNLDAEARGQLAALQSGQEYREGEATQAARIEYAAERLRLLYVGITRARSELIVTWNTGRRGEQVEARPVAALRGWWESQRGNSS